MTLRTIRRVVAPAALAALLAFGLLVGGAGAYPRPCHDDNCPPPTLAPWIVSGSLVKERHDPAVYVIEGAAKLWIPSPAEFDAMGYSWSDVSVVPDGKLRSVRDIPLEGTRLRERSSSTEWRIAGHVRNWGPVCDWAHPPATVPNGSLVAIPDGSGPAWGCL